MAFFDNLEKTLSKNNLLFKTKKMTDISGINSLVSDEKSESQLLSNRKTICCNVPKNFERNFVGINYIRSCTVHQNKRG